METTMKILVLGSHPAIQHAAVELNRYLTLITGLAFITEQRERYDPEQASDLWLGEMPAFGFPIDSPSPYDDEIRIQVKSGCGIIAGANPRSVLLAVYRFLHANGCRWVRPGKDGEYVPVRPLEQLHANLDEQASFRHRAITIEGAVSLQNCLDLIDWAPKVGFSGYFMQFREGHTFFDRWYRHQGNPLLAPEPFSVEQARDHTTQIEIELARRGMLYHAVGHGWTCEAFGIPGLGWDPVPQEWPPKVLEVLAEVDGQRKMWQDIPLVTALCLSNPRAFQAVVDCIANYAATHPQIDFLHVWLDDGFNNKCECAECQKELPSDQYIRLLNAVDDALSARNLPHKVVFLAYVDMLWAPQVEKIRNPERFVFMYAPISRTFREPLEVKDTARQQAPYVRNQLQFPSDIDGLLAHLREWQAVFQGDSFIFDYYLMNAGTFVFDPDTHYTARLIQTDIQKYPELGLNGLVSCQMQRVFFPTGLAMYTMGHNLWKRDVNYSELEQEYDAAAFGADAEKARTYLDQIARLQDLVRLGEKGTLIEPGALDALRQALDVIEETLPIIRRNIELPDICQARSWFYLDQHAAISAQFIQALLAVAQGDHARALRAWESLRAYVQSHESELQPVFDVCLFVNLYNEKFSRLQPTA
jgi:hypothetical protein